MTEKMTFKVFCWMPRIMALAFVGFISIFALDVFGEYSGVELLVALFMHLIPSLILLLIVFLAWKNAILGGIAFLCMALAYAFAVGFDRHWSWYVGISGPLFVLSLLFFASHFFGRKCRARHK